MRTLRTSTHHPHQLTTRLGGGVVALGALIAITAIAVIVALAGAAHARSADGAIQHPQPRSHTRPAAAGPASFAGVVRGPTTHAVLRVVTTTRNDWPSLASVLAPLTPRQRQYVLGIASLSQAQIAAAFGTGR